MSTAFGLTRAFSVTFLLVFALAQNGVAVSTSFFKAETFADFSKGTPENVSIGSDGIVTLSFPLVLKFESEEPYIWSVTVDPRGNIFAAAGEEGKVYKILPNGKSSLVFDAPEGEILSMVADRQGRLYAGSGPGGVIYEIDDSGGKVLFDSDEENIWCLCLDNNGDILAGTGSNGRLYRVKRNGKAEVILESGEPNITALAAGDGKVYAGTSGRGVLYVVEGKKADVLFDTELPEVRSIILDDSGDILLGCSSGGGDTGSEAQHAVGPPRRTSPEQGEAQPPAQAQPQGGSAVFQLARDGLVKSRFPIQQTLLCMERVPGGDLVLGMGEEGRILRVDSKGTVAHLNSADAGQVVCMAANGDLVLSTGDKGKVYSLGKEFASSGLMTSPAFDAGHTSAWGVISWSSETPKGTSVELETRTGNTREPDESWSDWSKKYDGEGASKVSSPEARFIQWRAQLTTRDPAATPLLRGVSLAYIQRNVRPALSSVVVRPEMVLEAGPRQDEEQGAATGTRHEFRGRLTVLWEAVDPNGDSLECTLKFKEAGQQKWLTMKEGIPSRYYAFDSQSLPDGSYRLMVMVTDSLSNPQGMVLSDSCETDPFIVDNTAPVIFRMGSDVKAGRRYRVTFQVEDEMTPIAACEYSVDASPWRPVFPLDQIFDTKEESFVLETPALTVGEHIVVVKVTDTTGNVAAKRLIIDAK